LLQGLGLNSNELSGTIPTQLGNLGNLEGLWLFNNQLSGPIPAELGDLSRLKWLHLAGNRLSGLVPISVATLGGSAPLAGNCWFVPNHRLYMPDTQPYRDADLDGDRVICGLAFDRVPVAIDIKPGSCPNTINAGHRGVVSVALLGSSTFDVTTVDPASAWMGNGVPPLRWSIEDVATPYGSMPEGVLDCTDLGSDGYPDLNFKFDLQELVASDEDKPEDGDVGLVSLIAQLKEEHGGKMIEGADIVRVVVKNPRW
jgi:hypothetical protein